MYITLGVLSEVYEQRVGTTHCGVEVVVERGVVHKQPQCVVLAVELGCKLLDVGNGLVYLLLGRLEVERGKVACKLVGVVEHAVGLCHHCRHVAVDLLHEGV